VPPRPVAAVTPALVAKGMQRDETHHHMFRKRVDGVTTLVTRISHSASEINDGLGSPLRSLRARRRPARCCVTTPARARHARRDIRDTPQGHLRRVWLRWPHEAVN